MHLENQELQNTANSLADQSLSNNLKENQLDNQKIEAEKAYVEQVVAEATQPINEVEKPTQFTIMITEAQENMAGAIRKALGLGFEVTLNSAIKYALFYAQNKQVSVSKLEEYPSSLGSHSLKIKVTPDTLHRLKESGATNQLSQCVVIGIQLLHERLINAKTNNEHL
ncbi:hypothetical protein [Iningainema tapete]|uniref:Uncharacterized protein n=1 Tax=Iningainema tapete BLCC-T55 TaxID=2748662 RepID=A0A8J6XS97_9CYAN|nr:hypothetical protein [Iningainema tapete]MBD2777409.1 hypothetical protein [Iningainema tapete BLCC-T55]